MPSKLTKCRAFDDLQDKHAEETEEPLNFKELKSEIMSVKPIDRVQKKYISEYQK